MTRRHFTFGCAGAELFATLDEAAGPSGLLLVSGGNEVRSGAWSGQARFAARVAAAGFPVMRFDRRGVGDSEGANGGFRTTAPDIAAALAAFRAQCPQAARIVGFGNCDAASALMLSGGAGFDALLLSNPWTIEDENAAAPASVVRAHYRRRLSDPAALRRLLTGKVAIRALLRSLASAARPRVVRKGGLAAELRRALGPFPGPVRFLVAGRDRTGLAFMALWDKSDPRIRVCPEATHSYVGQPAQDWLLAQTLALLRG